MHILAQTRFFMWKSWSRCVLCIKHTLSYYHRFIVFSHNLLDNIHHILITWFYQSISLGIVVGRVRQGDPILEEKLYPRKGSKILSIVSSDFGRSTKPCYYPILNKVHDDFLRCCFHWDGLYPPSEIVYRCQNPMISSVGFVLKFTNEI